MYTVLRSDEFDKWLAHLKDVKGKARIVARIRSAELGNLGDVIPIVPANGGNSLRQDEFNF
jgi:putative addiction module killer protein